MHSCTPKCSSAPTWTRSTTYTLRLAAGAGGAAGSALAAAFAAAFDAAAELAASAAEQILKGSLKKTDLNRMVDADIKSVGDKLN